MVVMYSKAVYRTERRIVHFMIPDDRIRAVVYTGVYTEERKKERIEGGTTSKVFPGRHMI